MSKRKGMTVKELREFLEFFDDDDPVVGFWEGHTEPLMLALGCQNHVVLDVDKGSDGSWTADEMNEVIGAMK